MKLALTKSTKISLLLALAVLLILGLGYYFLVKPQSDAAAASASEADSLRSQIPALKAELEELKDYNGEILPAFYNAQKAAPGEYDAPGAVIELQDAADRSKADLRALEVSSIEERNGYLAPTYTATLIGDFDEISEFLKLTRTLVVVRDGKVSARGHLYRVESLDLHPIDSSGSDQIEATLEMSATLPTSATGVGSSGSGGGQSTTEGESGAATSPDDDAPDSESTDEAGSEGGD